MKFCLLAKLGTVPTTAGNVSGKIWVWQMDSIFIVHNFLSSMGLIVSNFSNTDMYYLLHVPCSVSSLKKLFDLPFCSYTPDTESGKGNYLTLGSINDQLARS